MPTNNVLMLLFRKFCWVDEGLQSRLQDGGWFDVSRSQSMVMICIAGGLVRPAEIARAVGVSRQAIHATIAQMVKLGILHLQPDPRDRRHSIVAVTEQGARMRADAQQALDAMATQIETALGPDTYATMLTALNVDWAAATPPS